MTRIILFFIIVLLPINDSFSWGFHAHRIINKKAVFLLPPELLGFYKTHIDYLTEHSVRPDKRRYVSPNEAPRHYIDIDYYGEYPFDELPRKWEDAVAKYTEDTLLEYGILPWHLERNYYQLVNAFKNRDADAIISLSADIGHYIADAHSPLHTTLNYNGQLTGQTGIHALWESRLPELFSNEYDFFVNKVEFIGNPLFKAFEIVLQSHRSVDSLLKIEKELSLSFPTDAKHSYEQRGQSMVRVYSREYCRAYQDAMNGMVERFMRLSIERVASFWFSAWVDAGQPDMKEFVDLKMISEQDKKAEDQEADQELIEKKDVLGRPDL